jgi:hypothetical protein
MNKELLWELVNPLDLASTELSKQAAGVEEICKIIAPALKEMVSAKIKEDDALIIADQGSLDMVGDMVKEANKVRKDLESMRKTLTAPARETVDLINGLLTPIESDLEKHWRNLKYRIVCYMDEQAKIEEKRKLEAMKEANRLLKKADKQEEKGNAEKAEAIRTVAYATVNAEQPTLASAPSVNIRTTYSLSWCNAKGRPCAKPDMALIPIEYHLIDEQKILSRARDSKGSITIPGIIITSKRG